MEEIGLKLVKALEPVYNPQFEEKIFKDIISAFWLQSMDIDAVESILISIYDNLPSHSIERSQVFKWLDEAYNDKLNINNGIDDLKNYLTINCDKTVALRVIREIRKVIIPTSNVNTLKLALGSDKFITMDNRKSEVYYQSFTTVKTETVVNTTRVLLCYPQKIIEHNNPISDVGRTFSIVWRTKNNKYFKTEDMTQSEIENELYERGYVLAYKYLKTTVTALIQIADDNDILIQKHEIENSGFYYNKQENSLTMVDYTLKPLVKEEIEESLLLIEDLKNYFNGVEDKLATTLKHGLIAPFGFAKKQMGLPLEYLIPYLYHFGKAGSGKTTIARIGLWFYNKPNMNVNDIGGTEFDTVPRIGEQLRKSTFGLLVNEPETSLSKKSCAATLKTSMERTNARQRITGTRMEHILALAMVSFASNIPLPSIEGLPRRFVQILYSHNEKKTDEEKEVFMKHFKLNNPDLCEFNKLQYLANFAVTQIYDDVDLLKLDWHTLGNYLIEQAYEYVGREVPQWLLTYVNSVTDDDIDDEETEEIRMFFINEINKQSKQIKEYSYDTNAPKVDDWCDEVKEASDFHDRVHHVLNNQLLSYAMLHYNNKKNCEEVCFTNGLKKIFQDQNIKCYNIESTSQLLGWDYGVVKLNGSTKRCMRVSFEDFLNFLYPKVGDKDE